MIQKHYLLFKLTINTKLGYYSDFLFYERKFSFILNFPLGFFYLVECKIKGSPLVNNTSYVNRLVVGFNNVLYN